MVRKLIVNIFALFFGGIYLAFLLNSGGYMRSSGAGYDDDGYCDEMIADDLNLSIDKIDIIYVRENDEYEVETADDLYFYDADCKRLKP